MFTNHIRKWMQARVANRKLEDQRIVLQRREELAKDGCRAMISQLNKDGRRFFEWTFKNMTYPDGQPFPGEWRITVERMD